MVMQLQRTLTRSRKADLMTELVQTVSGLLLVGFLWTHMLFVGSILLGVEAFNRLAQFMEQFRLLDVAVVFIILTAGAHVAAVFRRIPGRWQEQKIVWKHAKTIKHADTWSWLFQAVTGSAMLVLIIIHVFIVVYAGINAKLSADRVHSWMLGFYIVLLLLAEYHASVGLYRALVKWGVVKRKSLKKVLTFITVCTIGLGLVSLWLFLSLGDSV
ncbi:succinate dehydrogenase [Cohnella pontilimi]|uniref:Succinate dehydrogenase n=2 Tax=Cohnella pontilimi TaxID=2564100 RepID=A0A4V5LRW2_9BACL|nr:succinate dehydrogenase [Cohnella pontilimi]